LLSTRGEEDELDRARRKAAELALVGAAADGSVEAFETLYRQHSARVYGLCLRMCADPALAEDCTQEVFLQAWRSIGRFERRSNFGTWLHRIAVNAVLGQFRRRREPLLAADAAEAALEESVTIDVAAMQGEGPDLEKAIASLPAGARHVLVLAGVYGYSHEETAAMLGVAVGTCKAQLHRARRLLGERLGLEEERT
jgi:RNA polymerase sigma-70 factor (ECF subfamily)